MTICSRQCWNLFDNDDVPSPHARTCRRTVLRAGCALLLSAACLGCGGQDDGPATIDVTGVVTLEGVPVERATVFFHPADRAAREKTSVGETDAEGRFTLQTHVKGAEYKRGALAGEYLVTVEKLEDAERTSTFTPPKDLLPLKYKDPQSSGLTATVQPGAENAFPLELSK